MADIPIPQVSCLLWFLSAAFDTLDLSPILTCFLQWAPMSLANPAQCPLLVLPPLPDLETLGNLGLSPQASPLLYLLTLLVIPSSPGVLNATNRLTIPKFVSPSQTHLQKSFLSH